MFDLEYCLYIVFLIVFDEYVIKVFEEYVFDYLFKLIEEKWLEKMLYCLCQECSKQDVLLLLENQQVFKFIFCIGYSWIYLL